VEVTTRRGITQSHLVQHDPVTQRHYLHADEALFLLGRGLLLLHSNSLILSLQQAYAQLLSNITHCQFTAYLVSPTSGISMIRLRIADNLFSLVDIYVDWAMSYELLYFHHLQL
jgi:hypothetical protein